MKTFVQATDEVISHADHLEAEHIGLITAIKHVALTLDIKGEEAPVSLLTEYRKLLNEIRDLSPETDGDEDDGFIQYQ